VIASLAGEAEEALLLAGVAAGAIPVASTADRDPLPDSAVEVPRTPRERRPRARPEPEDRRPYATLEAPPPRIDALPERSEPEGPHAERESGKPSDPEAPQRRYASDIEDFLL
jgi:hypothetical protein